MELPYPSETGCCPRFQRESWDEKEHIWENKLFVKDRVRCLFHVPLNFGRTMRRAMKTIGDAEAFTPEPPLVLSDHISKWTMDVYVEAAREVPGTLTVRLSGRFLSKVFEGPFKEAKQWCRQMIEWVQSKGQASGNLLMYYTTCPRCARHYGKNYVVLFAKI